MRFREHAMGSAKSATVLALLGFAAACVDKPVQPAAVAGHAAAAPAPVSAPAARTAVAAAESCADRWLAEHSLNPFGDPPETNYPGGTPLFDERTGVKRNRLEHLFAKSAALKSACSGAGQK